MHLIYKINFPSGKVYIGQTINFKDRHRDHLREARIGNDSKVYRAMRKYKITKESFEIIEDNIETQEEADNREIYWISYYDSFHYGYNSTPGGDVGNGGMLKGELGPNAAFTNEEVYKIRELKASMKYSKSEIFEMYANKISESGFNKIWNYTTYTQVAPEFNTPEIIYHYTTSRPIGTNRKGSKFTEEEITTIRELYYIEALSSKDIANLYNVNKSTIERIVSGKTYSNIPLPKASAKFKRKFHKYTNEEIHYLLKDFIDSELDLKTYLNSIKLDEENIFGGYVYSAFREFIIRELNKIGLKYVADGKWGFKIISI